jgi:hypothetical protein
MSKANGAKDPGYDPFDPDNLRTAAEQATAWQEQPEQAGRRKRQKEQFVMLPIAWKDRLRMARHVGTVNLAIHLQYLAWKTGGRSIQVTNTVAEEAGVTRRSKWRALTELSQLGLVVVERHKRRSPDVTVLEGGQS